MHILYFLLIRTVEVVLPIYSFFSKNNKIKAFVEGRKNIFKGLPLAENPYRYWFHCASLGEFEQARPVIEKLKDSNSNNTVIITFFSPSGYEQQKNFALAEAVIYLPLDTPSNARKLIAYYKPATAIFVKYEIWYFLLKTLFEKKIPVYLISANFRKGQAIFSIWGKWLFNLLPQYRQIFVQTENGLNLLKENGLKNICLSGDTRYDRVLGNVEKVKENTIIESFKAGKQLLILGSSWETEENILLKYLESETESVKHFQIIIAPHDISDKHILEIRKKFVKFKPVLYTERTNEYETSLMILNTIGHLASAYYYADTAFIGGGFTGQLHNILEPLAFGVPVITGPVHHKFPEAALALADGVLFEVSEAMSFKTILESIDHSALRTKAVQFIQSKAGATEIALNLILGKP